VLIATILVHDREQGRLCASSFIGPNGVPGTVRPHGTVMKYVGCGPHEWLPFWSFRPWAVAENVKPYPSLQCKKRTPKSFVDHDVLAWCKVFRWSTTEGGKHQKEIPRSAPFSASSAAGDQVRSSVDRAENLPFRRQTLSATGEHGQTPRNDGLLIITRVFVLNVPRCKYESQHGAAAPRVAKTRLGFPMQATSRGT